GANENVSKEVKKTSDAPIIEDWVSDCDKDETVVLESLNVQKPKQADQPRKNVTILEDVFKKTRTQTLTLFDKESQQIEAKDSEVCKITRADGTSSFHGDFQALLRRLDRQDLFQLYSLVQERYKHRSIEGHDLDLWGDLKMMFDPNEEDDIWLNQHYWELLRWKLHEYSGVHSLFLDGTSIQINMLVDKKYPLKKEILKKMINLKIEAEEESDMASELIKFIKSQIAEQMCMERVFLSPKGSGGGRGVKEKIGGSVDVSAKVNNGVDEGTTTSSNLAMNTQNPTDNAATNVVISPMGPISSAPTSNNWGKYGLVKSTLNSSTRLFFLQFSSMDSLDSMLENEDVVNVPVQVKLHGVPMKTFSEDGLSTIATKLDTTLMLDSYTYDISMQSWGRSSYARAMIELRADVELKDTTMMASKKDGYGTNSLLEQWKETYENADYDYDLYNNDMYEGLEIPSNIQSICDNFDIKV
ncbi:hypothetical protein Tco_1448891, partial [Tanacetum coccineum]